MVRNMNAEPRLPRISRRGLLCGAVGAVAATAGGLLMNRGDESQRRVSVETNAPKLDLEGAYEIYGAAYDMFLQCIREVPTTPIFTGCEPLALHHIPINPPDELFT